jgi:crotonobetainyl-CoA:carnitine CoA-transferase CaiB-like acyl-CoA transferase
MPRLPLEGIRIVDLTVVWAGPFAAALLGDLGAEVIRIETLQRPDMITRNAGNAEGMRKRGTDIAPDTPSWELSPNFNTVGRNRKSVTMDLSRPEGLDAFYRLIARSDVFIENNAPSTVVKLKADYQTLKQYNPTLIMASMSAFGADGPYRDYRAFGANIEAIVGYFLLRGYAEEADFVNSSGGFSDSCGGALAATAVLAALTHRLNTGQGQYIDMAQSESIAQTLSQAMMDYSMNGRSRRSTGNRDPERVPQGVYPSLGDDSWIAVSCGNDEEFLALCRLIGKPEYGDDPRFAAAVRQAQHDVLDDDITAWTSKHEAYDAFHILQEAGVPAAPVLDPAQVAADPHLQERGAWQNLAHPAAGTHPYLKSPIAHMSSTPLDIREPAPTLGRDNEYVYKEVLGFTDDEYQWFVDNGHAGTTYERAS